MPQLPAVRGAPSGDALPNESEVTRAERIVPRTHSQRQHRTSAPPCRRQPHASNQLPASTATYVPVDGAADRTHNLSPTPSTSSISVAGVADRTAYLSPTPATGLFGSWSQALALDLRDESSPGIHIKRQRSTVPVSDVTHEDHVGNVAGLNTIRPACRPWPTPPMPAASSSRTTPYGAST